MLTKVITVKFKLMRGTKIDRKCKICNSVIYKGDTEYYTRVADMDHAPHIENICANCIETVSKAG